MNTFSHSQSAEIPFRPQDLIQLFPFGISLSAENERPFLLLKDAKGRHTLPVAINPLEAGITLSQGRDAVATTTPHKFTSLLLKKFKLKAERCIFVQIKGAHQYVRIFLGETKQSDSIKLRADEAMSLCIHLGIPIFATLKFISESKIMTSELKEWGDDLRKTKHIVIKDHPYLM